MSNTAIASVMSFLVGFWVVYLGVAVLAIIAKWKVFEKAGEPGWAAIIPFYKDYILFKLSWGNGWYFLLTAVPALIAQIAYVSVYMSLIGQGVISAYGAGFDDYSVLTAMISSLAGFGLLMSLISLGVLAVKIIAGIKLAKAFGQGGGFAAGLILLNLIFLCILAFSKEIVYLGVPGKTPSGGAGPARPSDWQPVYRNPYYQPQDWQTPNSPPQSGAQYCPSCGAQLRPDDRFCSGCGRPR